MNSISSNHLLKVASLVFAVIFWFYVLNSEPIEVKREIPLLLIKPKGKAINNSVPKMIEVTFRGSRNFLNDLDTKKSKIFIDLKKKPYVGKNQFTVKLKSSDFNTPFGVKVLNFRPSTIPVSLEREIKKVVRVKANLVGELPSDFKLVHSRITPQEMMIIGPRSAVKKIGLLQTRPIDLASLEGDDKFILPLEKIDERVSIEGVPEVEFDYSMRSQSTNFSLENRPILFLSDKLQIKSKIKTAKVDLLVPKGREKLLNRSGVKIIAELPLKSRGTLKVKLRAELPEGIHLLAIHPESITVSVE